MASTIKSEFSWKKLSLNFHNKEENIHTSWIVSPSILLLFRLTLATFCIVITITSGVRKSDPRWFIYLTNWSFLFLTTAMIGLALISIIHVYGKLQNSETKLGKPSLEMRNCGEMIDDESTYPAQSNESQVESNSLSCYEKGVWFLWIIASNAALVVTINYWALVFEPPTNFMDIAVHALNSIVMLVELFMASTPVRILHVLYVMIFSVIYSLFTVIFWAAGGVTVDGDPYIYKVLDYENGDPAQVSAVLLGIVFVASPILQIILFALYQLRCFLHKKKANMSVAVTQN